MQTDAELEREDFLTVPPLFKYGPRVLLLAGLVVASLAVGAGLWRIHDGRKSEYEKGFTDSAATAAAAKENLEQSLGRLKQASKYVESIQQSAVLREQLAAVLNGLAMQGVALSRDGTLLAHTGNGEAIVPLARATLGTPGVGELARGAHLLLPAVRVGAAGGLHVPVVQRLGMPGPVEHLVFLLDEQALSGVVRKAFGQEGGWLHIENSQGVPVLDLLVASRRPGVAGKPNDKLRTPEQAMQAPLDYDSQRLLVATAPALPGEPRVSVGLTEAAAMVGVRKRIISTWVIVAFILPVIGSLGLTSFALRRFSTVEEYLRRLARIDVLTGLPNRRRFNSLLRRAVAQVRRDGSSLALLYIDIDDFKYVNDSLGHSVGDALLQHVGRAIADVVRSNDQVCRLGGDEFTVIATHVREPGALQLGNRILERLKEGVCIDGVDLRPKASIGIALMPQYAQTEEDLMRYADTAMYRAKNEGKHHCVVYDHSMAAQAVEKAQRMQELERAIAGEELFLVYQPKFELSSGALAGHEALVRWMHPTRGLVYPADFIALAEEAGLIAELGDWVLERALRQIRDWHEQGHGWHRVAVNVSALQLRDDAFVDRVKAGLERYGVHGSQLQVEITESTLAANPAKMRAMLRRLREHGVLIAVDDFGTGYSSLAALQQYDLDMLKVDRSFVSLVHTRQGQAVCRAIVTLGHALGMTVVGEGVETPEQASILRSLGCDQVQGYYFARPLGADAACVTGAADPWSPSTMREFGLVEVAVHNHAH